MTAPAPAPPRDGAGRTARSAPGPLRTELRRGLGPWTGAAIVVTMLVTMYAKAPEWQIRWQDAENLLHPLAGLLCGPLAMAAGCLQGGRDRRLGTEDLWASVPRSPLPRLTVAAAPSALWPAAAVLLGDAGVLLAVWPYASWGRPALAPLLADAVAVGAMGLVGHVVGRVVRWRLTAPLLAVAGYTGFAYADFTSASARWLLPSAQFSAAEYRQVWWYAPASAAWTAGLALAFLLAYGLRSSRARLLALVPLTVAACAAAAILRLPADGGPWRIDPAAVRPVCDDGTPRVCVVALDARLLPALTETLEPVNERLRGLPGAPARWAVGRMEEEPGDVTLLDIAQDVVRNRIEDPALYRHYAVMQLFSKECREGDLTGPHAERAMDIHLAVAQWLAPSPPGYGPHAPGTRAHLDRLRAKSPAEQRAYLVRYLAANGCRPGEVPVP
ncbi:hypothetical protein ACFVU3_00770 [Streptomyces sp. NPDC058052]|uniref:hypothetical protein n=1 Tax=Streptomyces sp. NPDC058052 TaxID=3346316 RepID=UPI0036F09641